MSVRPSLPAIRAINRRLVDIDEELSQADAELGMNRHIADDAERDFLVSGRYEDRADARMTARDVKRVEKLIAGLQSERTRLVAKRDRMIRDLSEA